MNAHLIEEILQCLRGERTLFYYYPDHYAVYLLQRFVAKRGSVPLTALRASRLGALLQRPGLKSLFANCGSGVVSPETLNDVWFKKPEVYVLTLGRWGTRQNYGWAQTSRPGSNLVLQLNLSRKWSRAFQSFSQRSANRYFDFGHPLSESRSVTLAWARLDMDFETDEILVEEIQSDLVREIRSMRRLAELRKDRESFNYRGVLLNPQEVLHFGDHFLEQFDKTWQEAMLTATLQFSFEELGVSRLYYHSFETGNVLKNIRHSKPPRSLYSKLPKKFCFEITEQAPVFLQEEKKIRRKLKRLGANSWFTMAA